MPTETERRPQLNIDGNNVAYRALLGSGGYGRRRSSGLTGTAAQVHSRSRSAQQPEIVLLLMLSKWLRRFNPASANVFWDCHGAPWRRKIAPQYKGTRYSLPHHSAAVQQRLSQLIDNTKAILQFLGVRQYERGGQEADDLIYAACRAMAGGDVVVVSSDSDLQQLAWLLPSVKIYCPGKDKVLDRPKIDPVVQKALCGDSTDNIEGFRGIGQVKSAVLMERADRLYEFIEAVDSAKFKRNLALIDLTANPSYINNYLYVLGVMAQPVQLDKKRAIDVAIERKIVGFMSVLPKLEWLLKRIS